MMLNAWLDLCWCAGEHRELWRDVVGGRATMDDFRKLRWANLGTLDMA